MSSALPPDGWVTMEVTDLGWSVRPPGPPWVYGDLLAALRLGLGCEAEVQELLEIVSDPGMFGPGGCSWSSNILMWSAMLSPEHEARMRHWMLEEAHNLRSEADFDMLLARERQALAERRGARAAPRT